MNKLRILGILIKDRIKEAGKTQELLTNNGHLIRTRTGFHEVTDAICSRTGMIILTLGGDDIEQVKLINSLNNIGGIDVKEMVFEI